MDIQRDQLGALEVEALMLLTAEEDGKEVPIVIEQEPGAAGKAYALYIKNNILERLCHSLCIRVG